MNSTLNNQVPEPYIVTSEVYPSANTTGTGYPITAPTTGTYAGKELQRENAFDTAPGGSDVYDSTRPVGTTTDGTTTKPGMMEKAKHALGMDKHHDNTTTGANTGSTYDSTPTDTNAKPSLVDKAKHALGMDKHQHDTAGTTAGAYNQPTGGAYNQPTDVYTTAQTVSIIPEHTLMK